MAEPFYPGAPRDVDEAARRIHDLLFRQQRDLPKARPQHRSAWEEQALELADILGFDSRSVRSAGPEVLPILQGIANYPNFDRHTQGRLNAAIRGLRQANPDLADSMTSMIGSVTKDPSLHITAMSDAELQEHRANLEKVRSYLPIGSLIGPGVYSAGQLGLLGTAGAAIAAPAAAGVGLLGAAAGAGIPMQLKKIDAELKRRGLPRSTHD